MIGTESRAVHLVEPKHFKLEKTVKLNVAPAIEWRIILAYTDSITFGTDSYEVKR